jgi:Tol biopolymer transport system component
MAIDQLPGPGGYPWHFSPDDSMILFNRLEGRRRGIFLWGRDSGETTSLLMDQEQSYYQGQFSPDQRWVAWETSRGELQVARFRGARSIPPSERIQISNVGLTAQKPRWSPDGNLLYHLSSQDGFVCIYAQPLDPATKQPRGESVDLYHSHGTRNTIGNVEMSTRAISVASDKIVFSMSDRTGNIWLIEPVE